MRTTLQGLILATLAVGAMPTLIVPALAAETAAAPAAHYSVTTTLVGKLLDDPAANEVLKKLIPSVYANEMFQSAGRSLTLADIQQYEPDTLTAETMTRIQSELNKIPAKG